LLSDGEITALVERFGVEDQRTRGVLLVDDEPLNLKVLRGFLDDAWRVYEASSGHDALRIAAEVPLDVVVTDQRMPGMTGIELLERLRRHRPDVAGIVLTGYVDAQALESAINRAAVFRYVRKPCDAFEIVQIVDQASAHVAQRRTMERVVSLLVDRTDQLSGALARLEAHQRMLIDVERLGTIGRLSSGVTHDLRNVMVALRSAEWEIAESTVAPTLRETMTAGMAGIDNLLRTLQTLHEYARTGSLALQLGMVSPGSIVNDALAIARMDMRFRCRHVECDLPSDLPQVRADRQKLTQVLVNLVRNALQATDEHAGVRIAASARSNGETEFTVEDEGPGVSPELRDRLFQPFVSSKGGEGLGMGLYMARLIVESHHGCIAVEDRPQGGARFAVVLPPAASAGPA
jgi:signal transduction histidine kinase